MDYQTRLKYEIEGALKDRDLGYLSDEQCSHLFPYLYTCQWSKLYIHINNPISPREKTGMLSVQKQKVPVVDYVDCCEVGSDDVLYHAQIV